MKPKQFVSITSEVLNGKTVLINTSAGEMLANENGLSFNEMIDFLFSLVNKRSGADCSITFVCFAFSRDNEFIFSSLPHAVKDKLFKAFPVKNKITELQDELESLDTTLYTAKKDSQEFERADFDKHVNKLSLAELVDVKHGDYQIILNNGKILTIRKKGKSISIYDLWGFYKPNSLRDSVKTWLGKDIAVLDRYEFDRMKLAGVTQFDRLKLKSYLEVKAVAELATKLDTELRAIGVNLSRYHGASAISSYWLGKIDAKKDFYNYRYRRQLAPELYKAVRQSYYAARAEQLKIGTGKGVFVYDINSAYGYAASFLPTMLRKPYYRQEWENKPFSIWFCEYDLTKSDYKHHFGLLPTRDLSGHMKFALRGSGYFWQPEVVYMLTYFPECITIKGGFSMEHEPAPFTKGIECLYQLRLELQAQGNPLEKVIGLALSSIYGKFMQHNGKGRYYNLFYAGFITSLTRTMLLQAARANEQSIICFLTDAIHSEVPLNVPQTNQLGHYKCEYYDRATYLDSGVYQSIRDGKIIKQKSQGFRHFDFDKALIDLSDKNTYSALCEFFVGHNVYTENRFTGADYLTDYKQQKSMNPIHAERATMRLFDACKVDLKTEYLNSQPVTGFTELESTVYTRGGYKMADAGIDTIEAGRI